MGKPGIFCFCALLGAMPSAAKAQSGWDYGKKGLEWSDTDSGSYLWLGLRGQLRYLSNESDFHTPDDYDSPQKSDTLMNRSRFKIGAGIAREVNLYQEYDLVGSRLLDLKATWVANPDFHIRVGQWKTDYNRERIDSSGKQQFIERSIATYWFTIDRQWGAVASGRVWQGDRADSNWWAGVLGGNGRGNDADGGRPMVLGRWQWNYTGNRLPFSQSALKRYEKPHGSLAIAVVTNDSKYTRFSGNGGGQLPGYDKGESNQYRTYQAMQEWAWHKGGLSAQQELHWKSIEDRRNGSTQHLYGGYAQLGWFPSSRWQHMPENTEIAVRGAYVNTDLEENLVNTELTLAINWFFNGHRNKLTFDTSYLSSENDAEVESDIRYRLQWELSI